MFAGGGDLDGAAEGVLALYFGEVTDGQVGAGFDGNTGCVWNRRDSEFAFEKTHGLVERCNRVDGDSVYEGGFVG